MSSSYAFLFRIMNYFYLVLISQLYVCLIQSTKIVTVLSRIIQECKFVTGVVVVMIDAMAFMRSRRTKDHIFGIWTYNCLYRACILIMESISSECLVF